MYYFPRTVDDMFIFLRYAENLVAGNGLVFNVGEPVEGFSSPLWVLLLAAGVAIGFNGVTWAKLMGLVTLVALARGTYVFARERVGMRSLPALGSVLFLAMNSYLISWGMYGLETPAYLVLMVWTAIWLGRQMDAPSRSNAMWAGVVAAGLSLSRPEAPLFLIAVGVALAVERATVASLLARVRASVPPALIVIGTFGAYLAFRLSYFGLMFPHTYYAKRGHGLSFASWDVVYANGVSTPELVVLAGVLPLGIWLAAKKRSAVPVLVTCMSLFFVAKVIPDWMPNVRHLLPIWLFAPMLWFAGVDALWSAQRTRIGAVVGVLVLAVCAGSLWTIDSRFSAKDFATHGRGENWVQPKSNARWSDAWRASRGVPPHHVADFGTYHHGMITQLYQTLESDAQPLEDSWFVGRDIGRIGWLAPVGIFESDGLFTPAVVASPNWVETRGVDADLLRVGFGRYVVMTELLDGWRAALEAQPAVRNQYESIIGDDPFHLARRDRTRPSPELVLARYHAAESKFPRGFYVLTLYGRAVGALFERRVRYVEQAIAGLTAPPAVDGEPLATFDDNVTLESCVVTPAEVRPGETATVRCVFAVAQPLDAPVDVFVHVDGDGGRLNADHAPAAGFIDLTAVAPGTRFADVAQVLIPGDDTAAERTVYVGLWNARGRLVAAGPTADADHRVNVGRVRILGNTAP